MTLGVELFSVLLGQLLAAITPSPRMGMLLDAPIIIVFALFWGMTVPGPQMPAFWWSWLFELDPFSRVIRGMKVTELHGRT